jgi:hypothetical protein
MTVYRWACPFVWARRGHEKGHQPGTSTWPVDKLDAMDSYSVGGEIRARNPRGRGGGAGWHCRHGADDLHHWPHWSREHIPGILLSLPSPSLLSTKSLGMGDPMRRYRRSGSECYRNFHGVATPESFARQFLFASCSDVFPLTRRI